MTDDAFGSRAYWRARARAELDIFGAAVAAHGCPLDPDLQLVEDDGCPYCYYDLKRGIIGLGLPDLTTRVGRFQWVPYLRLLRVTTLEAAAHEVDALLRFLMVHEATHHLRHRRGRMVADDWEEEHVVNILAVAYLRTCDDGAAYRDSLLARLERMRAGLETLREWPLIEATHDDLEEVLFHHLEVIDEADYHAAFVEAARVGAPVMEVIRSRGLATEAEIARALADQAEARRRYNAEYMKDITTYWLLCVAQLQVELVDPDLPEFADALAKYVGPASS